MPRYLIGTFIYFWIPVAMLGFFMRNRLDPSTKKALWVTLGILTPMTFAMEYVYLWADIWTFSEDLDPLLGIRIWGAPIEEFSFWFGATPFILLVYLAWDRILRRGFKKDA